MGVPEIYPWVFCPAGPEAPEVVIGARGGGSTEAGLQDKVPGHWEASHFPTGDVFGGFLKFIRGFFRPGRRLRSPLTKTIHHVVVPPSPLLKKARFICC